MVYGDDFFDDSFDEVRNWENQYAKHLEDLMEAQYWDELEERYNAGLEAELRAEFEGSRINLEQGNGVQETMKYHEDVAHRVLHLPMEENDAGAATVGEYLGLLLSTLWLQKEGFSGKRPFGNSDWDSAVYIAMGNAGLCEIELDEDGYIETFSQEAECAADELILQAIRLLYKHE